jgi:hypothetical protein
VSQLGEEYDPLAVAAAALQMFYDMERPAWQIEGVFGDDQFETDRPERGGDRGDRRGGGGGGRRNFGDKRRSGAAGGGDRRTSSGVNRPRPEAPIKAGDRRDGRPYAPIGE